MYIGRLYEKIMESKLLYSRKKANIPCPEFIVLYNGREELPDESVLRLSDLFEKVEGNDKIELELEVKVYNINKGRNPAIEGRCASLNGYAELVAKARENEKAGMDKAEAVKEAVKHCIREGTLGGFLREHGSEVENMLLTEWNLDDALQVCREESWEDGWEKGIAQGMEKGREQGIEQGLEKGIEQGLEKGIEKGRRETWEGFAELLSHSKTLEDLKKMFETSTR
jgi:hypothetical protein